MRRRGHRLGWRRRRDPDGNEIELYVDTSDAWKDHPERVAHAEPLAPD